MEGTATVSASPPPPHEPPGRVVEELAGRTVGPVDVVEHEEQAAILCPELQQCDHRFEEAQLCLGGVAFGRARRALRQLREELGQLVGRRPEGRAQGRPILLVQVLSDGLDEGQVGRASSASEQLPQRTSQPSLRARRVSSVASRVLPIPASPASRAKRPSPRFADRRASSSCDSSSCRPTRTGERTRWSIPGFSQDPNLASRRASPGTYGRPRRTRRTACRRAPGRSCRRCRRGRGACRFRG